MLLLEILQHIKLLLLITSRFPHLLLALIKHHLLNHGSRLPVQVAKFAAFRAYLGDVDFWGTGYDVCPPFHLVYFVEVEF